MATDLAATSATGNSPVVTSATYNFAAGDIGDYVFIKSGTNWIPGWYKIASVASNAATLNAAIGQVVLYTNSTVGVLNTAAGCATTASPTAGTWSVDYTQTGGVQISYTDMIIGATTTQFTSILNPAGPNLVGNMIQITSGTGFTLQTVEVTAFTAAGLIATCDKSLGTTASTGGHGGLGGALATPGKVGGLMVGQNIAFVKNGTYTQTSATSNIAAGRMTPPAGTNANLQTWVIGYNITRTLVNTDATKPLLRAGVNSGTQMFLSTYTTVRNVDADNPSAFTSCTAYTIDNNWCCFENCSAKAYTNGFNDDGNTGNRYVNCYATGCGNSFIPATSSVLIGCTSLAHTTEGFKCSGKNYIHLFDCLCANGTGGDGFDLSVNNWSSAVNCVSYNNASGSAVGFDLTSSNGILLDNCIAYSNAGGGIMSGGVSLANCWFFNVAVGNNTGSDIDAKLLPLSPRGTITLTAIPFTNAGSNDFSLNTTAGGGALLRAAGFPSTFQGLSTTSHLDVGLAQHADPAATGGMLVNPRKTGGKQ